MLPTFLAAAFSIALASAQSPPAAQASPQELARSLQQKYEQIQDFSADFEHIYQGGLLNRKVTERGTVLVKKPGLMHWTYQWPEKKEFVSDGKKLYSYIPEDKQVTVTLVPPADEASSPALFLAGKGDIARDFAASAASVPGIASDEIGLKLVPRKAQAEYDWLVLVVARGSLQLRRLVTTDSQGGTSTFVFSHFRENVRLPDNAFTFRIPRGVEVIDGTRSR